MEVGSLELEVIIKTAICLSISITFFFGLQATLLIKQSVFRLIILRVQFIQEKKSPDPAKGRH